MRFLFFTLVFLAITNNAHALSLQQALQLTAKNNPTLQAQNLQSQSVQDGENIAATNIRPNISANANAGVAAIDTDLSKRETLTPAGASISIVQSLYRGGRSVAEMAQARAQTQSALALQQDTTQQVLLAAGTVFMDVLRDQAVQDLQQKNITVLAKQREAEQAKFDVGVVTKTDVAQAQSRLAAAQASLASAQAQLKTSQARFLELVGQEPNQLIYPTGQLKLPKNLDDALSLAQAQHPQIKSARANAEAGQKQVAVIAGENRPTLNAVGTLQQQWDSSAQLDNLSDGRAILQLDIPIYTQGRVQARQAQAVKVAASQQQQIMVAERAVKQQMVAAWQAYEAALASQKARTTQFDAASLALEGVRAENQNGTRTTLDVLNAEQELLNAKVAQVQAKRDLWVAQLQVLSATGQLTPQAIGAQPSAVKLPLKEGPKKPPEKTLKKVLAKGQNPA